MAKRELLFLSKEQCQMFIWDFIVAINYCTKGLKMILYGYIGVLYYSHTNSEFTMTSIVALFVVFKAVRNT